MSKLFILISTVAIVSFSFWSLSGRAEELGSKYTLCKLGKEVRTLRIEKGADKCTTQYNKNGKDQSLGTAMNESSCEGFLDRVRSNLEKAGWKCREVKDASVSNLISNEAQ